MCDNFGTVWDQNHVYFHGRFDHAYLPQNSPNLTFLTEVSLILSCILKSILDPSLTSTKRRQLCSRYIDVPTKVGSTQVNTLFSVSLLGSYQRWLDKIKIKLEMKFWAVLGSRGCREKKLPTAISMQLFGVVFL